MNEVNPVLLAYGRAIAESVAVAVTKAIWEIHCSGAAPTSADVEQKVTETMEASLQTSLNNKAPAAPKAAPKTSKAAKAKTAAPPAPAAAPAAPEPVDDFGTDGDDANLFAEFDAGAAPADTKSEDFGDFGDFGSDEGFAGDAAYFGAYAGASSDTGGFRSSDADQELPDGPDEEGLYVVAGGTVCHYLDCTKGDWRIKGTRKVTQKNGKIMSWSQAYATQLCDDKGKPVSGFCVLLDESEAPAPEGQIDKGFWVCPTAAVRAHVG